jgi:uncharacterized protein involved in exopolysaccharide biosynthesis
MKSTETVYFKPDSLNLMNLGIKYWRVLIITFLAVVIISFVISFTITPLYRSEAVLYPTTNVVESQTLLGIQTKATALFGDETATEKVLQILRSDKIKDYLVSKYNLIKHYGIGEHKKYKYTLLNNRIKKYIISRKTQYNSIEISVLDSDPVIASAMANDIALQIDTVFNQIVKEAGRKSFIAVNNSYNDQFKRVKSLEDSLQVIIPKGSSSFYQGSLKAGLSNSNLGIAAGQYSPEFLRLINMFETENENLSRLRSRLSEAKMAAEQDLPYIYIINTAKVSEKKALPQRSIIVIASSFSTLLLLLFILGLSDSVVKDEK